MVNATPVWCRWISLGAITAGIEPKQSAAMGCRHALWNKPLVFVRPFLDPLLANDSQVVGS